MSSGKNAPFSMRNLTASFFLSFAALWRGVPAKHKRYHIKNGISNAKTEGKSGKKIKGHVIKHFFLQRWKYLQPQAPQVLASISAPRSSNSSITSRWPPWAARWRGVKPFDLGPHAATLTSIPPSSRRFTCYNKSSINKPHRQYNS